MHIWQISNAAGSLLDFSERDKREKRKKESKKVEAAAESGNSWSWARAPPLCESAKSKGQGKGEHLSHTHSVGSDVKEHQKLSFFLCQKDKALHCTPGHPVYPHFWHPAIIKMRVSWRHANLFFTRAQSALFP